jgi:glycosyltransferase involved in cell wall biosynthesis
LDERIVGSDLMFHKLRLQVLDRLMPLNLAKAWIDTFLRKIPEDVELIYAYNHPVFRKKPWIVSVEWAHVLVGRDMRYFTRYRKSAEKLLGSDYCRKILTWTEAAKKSILLNFRCDDFEHKIEIMPPAVHGKDFIKDYRHDKVRLLFVGSANDPEDFEAKGGKEALQTFAILNSKYKNLELVVRAKLPTYIRDKYAGLRNLRVVEEVLSWQLLEQEFKQADIFLFPSHLLHNTVVLEAMSYELPVVATEIGATNGEYVEDGVTGFVVASSKKLPYFLDNFILTSETIHRSRLIKAARNVESDVVDELVAKTSLLIENNDLRRKMAKAARWEVDHGRFSIEKRNEKLKRIFDEAISK